ncbi:unnamed protein product [Rhizoctonia solani]|uniref:AA9 family lytic polysaccharide monooxygenase n=1 Tax=Rhizoctonia solani TaxID=456999 RepID=A0A8H3D036_9AGAM|nr:unnamed protein product [Rhizoctonia solani]
MRTGNILAALAAAYTAHAHATFQYLWVDGVDEGGKCVRTPAGNSPIADPTSNTLACNANGEVSAASICPIAAGSKVAVEMHQHNNRDCTEEAIGGNHDGPTIIYMAKVENAASAVGSEANWFKVAEAGLVSKDYWGTDVMNANCGKVEFTIPPDIPAGNYLIRAEVIALHVAGSVGGAQFYMSCYQINVTGGGAASPATVKFPGAYSATDPGILFNVNGAYTSYAIPGPPVYSPGGSYGGSPPDVATKSTVAITSATSTSTAVTPTAVYPTEAASYSTGIADATSSDPSTEVTSTPASTDVTLPYSVNIIDTVSAVAYPTEAASTSPYSVNATDTTSAAAYSMEVTSTPAATDVTLPYLVNTTVTASVVAYPTEAASTSAADTDVTSASAIATEVARTSVTTTSSTVTTTTPSAAHTATDLVAKYYQCGGLGWTGGTACVAGATCVIQNPFYHQCL